MSFRFKQFEIEDNLCGMKVGTDGVILGAWCDVAAARRVLDVGTGTGLIALMIAQRSDARIDGIDISRGAFDQSESNFRNSKWSDRLQSFHKSLYDFSISNEVIYSHIVSNPPYFTNSFKPSDKSRLLARHTDELPYKQLIKISGSLLDNKGKISLIVPSSDYNLLLDLADDSGLFLRRTTWVYPKPSSDPKRVLIELSNEKGAHEESDLTIESERHVYTPAYIRLTGEFYLKM